MIKISKLKNESLLRGFLNLYEIDISKYKIESQTEYCIIKKVEFLNYPLILFNILATTDALDYNPLKLSQYVPLLIISESSPKNLPLDSPYIEFLRIDNGEFLQIYSFYDKGKSSWKETDPIEPNLLFSDLDMANKSEFDLLKTEEKNFQNLLKNIDGKLGKIESFISKLYKANSIFPGIILKNFFTDIPLFSEKSPLPFFLNRLFGLIFTENKIKFDQSKLDFFGSINNITNIPFLSAHIQDQDFYYDHFFEDYNTFNILINQSCINLISNLMLRKKLRIDGLLNDLQNNTFYYIDFVYKMKQKIFDHYKDFLSYIGIIQYENDDKVYCIPNDHQEFLDLLNARFVKIETEIKKLNAEYPNFARETLCDITTIANFKVVLEQLSEFSRTQITINQVLSQGSSVLMKFIKDFYIPLLFFSLFIGLSNQLDFFIEYDEITEDQNSNLITQLKKSKRTLTDTKKSNSIYTNINILSEFVITNLQYEKKQRNLIRKHIRIIPLGHKIQKIHDYILWVSDILDELSKNISQLKDKIISSFPIKNISKHLAEINDKLPNLRDYFFSYATVDVAFTRRKELNQEIEDLNQKFDDFLKLFDKLKSLIKDIFEKCASTKKILAGCANFDVKIESIYKELEKINYAIEQIPKNAETSEEFNLEDISVETQSLIDEICNYDEILSKLISQYEKNKEACHSDLEFLLASFVRAENKSTKKTRSEKMLKPQYIKLEDSDPCGIFISKFDTKTNDYAKEGNYVCDGCWEIYVESIKDSKIPIEDLNKIENPIQLNKKIMEKIDKISLEKLKKLKIITEDVVNFI